MFKILAFASLVLGGELRLAHSKSTRGDGPGKRPRLAVRVGFLLPLTVVLFRVVAFMWWYFGPGDACNDVGGKWIAQQGMCEMSDTAEPPRSSAAQLSDAG